MWVYILYFTVDACVCTSVHIRIRNVLCVFDLQMMVRQHFIHWPKC